MTALTLQLPDDLRRGFEDEARALGVPVDAYVTDCLRRFRAMQAFDRLTELLEPRLRAAGFTSEEEVLRALSS